MGADALKRVPTPSCMDDRHHHLVSHHRTMVVEAASQRLGGSRHDESEEGHDVGHPYKRAVNVRRDPLQRVRDNGVPTGRLRGGAMRHAIVALSTRQPFAPRACLPTTNSYTQSMGYPRKV